MITKRTSVKVLSAIILMAFFMQMVNAAGSWSCYNGRFTCYTQNREGINTLYATNGQKTWFRYNNQWIQDTRMTVQWSTVNKDKATINLRSTRNGRSNSEPIYKIYWTGIGYSYLPVGITPKSLTLKDKGLSYFQVGGLNGQGCYLGIYVDTQFNTRVLNTNCKVSKQSADTYRIDF